ncbi:MAG: hypothetical protein HY064_01025 [Bacteroidetes bacterium]|nr:hypothetical protein [Bacteroidota bacterium]
MRPANSRDAFSFAIKLAIVLLAVGYIVWRLQKGDDPVGITTRIFREIKFFPVDFLFVFFLMPVNWALESLKWKLAAGQQVQMNFMQAVRGVLAGVTIGTATPNRVGEFAGRIFMEKEEDRLPLLFLSFICSFCQVMVTFLAGIAGMLVLGDNAGLTQNEKIFIYVSGALFCCTPFLLPLLSSKWKERTKQLRNFPISVFSKIFFLSIIRYGIYVFQFALLLHLEKPEMFLSDIIGGILVCYLVITLVPTFAFTEVLIRGSIAGLVFSASGFGKAGFIAAVVLWIINVAIPSLIGSIFVFRLKFFNRVK